MGNSIPFLKAEQQSWLSHTVEYDTALRQRLVEGGELDRKFPDGRKIQLCAVKRQHMGVSFEHWFITDGVSVFEFGGPDLDPYDARVHINPYVPRQFESVVSAATNSLGEATLTADVKERMRHVIGMRNYSLCLRNCEHVANYVFRGKWLSHQMNSSDGSLKKLFHNYLLKSGCNVDRTVNSFPDNLRPLHLKPGSRRQLYPFLQNRGFEFTGIDTYLDAEEDTLNYLILGAAGVGKSRCVNVLFNSDLVEEGEQLFPVTRELCFLRGSACERVTLSSGRSEIRRAKIVLIDTIGFCDLQWSDAEVERIIRSRVSANVKNLHGVLFLVDASSRLHPQTVTAFTNISKWLKLEKYPNNINYCLTRADRLAGGEESKMRIRQQLIEQLHIKKVTEEFLLEYHPDGYPITFTSFPQEVPADDQDNFLSMRASAYSSLTATATTSIPLSTDSSWCPVM